MGLHSVLGIYVTIVQLVVPVGLLTVGVEVSLTHLLLVFSSS